MNSAPTTAVERAQALGIDISLLIENLRLSPTERVRRGEAFARFALSIREQARQAREREANHAADADRANPEEAA